MSYISFALGFYISGNQIDIFQLSIINSRHLNYHKCMARSSMVSLKHIFYGGNTCNMIKPTPLNGSVCYTTYCTKWFPTFWFMETRVNADDIAEFATYYLRPWITPRYNVLLQNMTPANMQTCHGLTACQIILTWSLTSIINQACIGAAKSWISYANILSWSMGLNLISFSFINWILFEICYFLSCHTFYRITKYIYVIFNHKDW